MKLIEKLYEYIEEEVEDAKKYAECSLKYKEENPVLAKTFYDISVEELKHMTQLHDEIVRAINEYRQVNGDPPERMQAVYDYLHQRQIDDTNEVKVLHGIYKIT